MKKNMSIADRLIRILAAITIVVLFSARVIAGPLGYILLVLAAINLLASLAGRCPMYSIIGIRTCSAKNAPTSK